jgi:hypothetical protein
VEKGMILACMLVSEMIYYKCESSILDMLGNGELVEVKRKSRLWGSKGGNGKLEVEVESRRPFIEVTRSLLVLPRLS